MNLDNIPAVEFASIVGEHILDAVDRETVKVEEWKDYFRDAEFFRFRLDGKVYVAVESPDDGYRSSMKMLFVSDDPMKNVFTPCKVLARVNTEETDGYRQVNDTLELIDCVTGKIVLRAGTDNTDDYYPWFVSEFNPENMAANVGK